MVADSEASNAFVGDLSDKELFERFDYEDALARTCAYEEMGARLRERGGSIRDFIHNCHQADLVAFYEQLFEDYVLLAHAAQQRYEKRHDQVEYERQLEQIGRLRAQVEQLMAAKQAEAAPAPELTSSTQPKSRMTPEHYAARFHNWSAAGSYRGLLIGVIGVASALLGIWLLISGLIQLTLWSVILGILGVLLVATGLAFAYSFGEPYLRYEFEYQVWNFKNYLACAGRKAMMLARDLRKLNVKLLHWPRRNDNPSHPMSPIFALPVLSASPRLKLILKEILILLGFIILVAWWQEDDPKLLGYLNFALPFAALMIAAGLVMVLPWRKKAIAPLDTSFEDKRPILNLGSLARSLPPISLPSIIRFGRTSPRSSALIDASRCWGVIFAAFAIAQHYVPIWQYEDFPTDQRAYVWYGAGAVMFVAFVAYIFIQRGARGPFDMRLMGRSFLQIVIGVGLLIGSAKADALLHAMGVISSQAQSWSDNIWGLIAIWMLVTASAKIVTLPWLPSLRWRAGD